MGRRGRRGGGTSRAVRSRSCWRQEPFCCSTFIVRKIRENGEKKLNKTKQKIMKELKKKVDQMSTGEEDMKICNL